VLFTNVVVLGVPLKFTTEFGTKPCPFTINVSAGPPVAVLGGESEVMAGTPTTTDWAIEFDVLETKFESPPYCAVIECEPAPSDDVSSTATPLEFRVLAPSELAPSKNVAVPVGVPAPGALTVILAVNVTAWPTDDELAEDARPVAVEALLTD
jgi:hypothetical protein